MLRPCGGYKSFAALGARKLFVEAVSSPACGVAHQILPVPFPSLVRVLAGLDHVLSFTSTVPALINHLVEPTIGENRHHGNESHFRATVWTLLFAVAWLGWLARWLQLHDTSRARC